jgi:cytochrome b561
MHASFPSSAAASIEHAEILGIIGSSKRSWHRGRDDDYAAAEKFTLLPRESRMIDTILRRSAVPVTSAVAYTLVARVLHWITAVLVLAMIPLGIVIANIEDLPRLYDLHRSIGVVLLLIVLIRLAYRVTHPPLPLPRDIPLMQRLLAGFVHWTLYAVLIVQPIVGWIATSAYGAPITVFWVFALPPICREDRVFSDQFFAAHAALGIALAVVISAHVGGALFHHFIRKDRVLMRILTG